MLPALGDVNTVRDGEKLWVEYRHRDAKSLGAFHAVAKLTPITTQGVELATVTVPIDGVVRSEFRLCPSELFFPAQSWTITQQLSASIQPVVNVPFTVNIAEEVPKEVSILFGDRPSEREAQPVLITLKPSGPGRRRWGIPIQVQPLVPGASPVELNLVVRAYGVEALPAADGRGEGEQK